MGHEYFQTPCTQDRFGLHVMQAYRFFPCSHPPVQATHRRLNMLCRHTKCILHRLQLDLFRQPWGQMSVSARCMVCRRGFVLGPCRRFLWCFISVFGFGVLFFGRAKTRATTGQDGAFNALRSARGLCLVRRGGPWRSPTSVIGVSASRVHCSKQGKYDSDPPLVYCVSTNLDYTQNRAALSF